MWFASTICSTVTPYRRAMLVNVSPEATMWIVGDEPGACVPRGEPEADWDVEKDGVTVGSTGVEVVVAGGPVRVALGLGLEIAAGGGSVECGGGAAADPLM